MDEELAKKWLNFFVDNHMNCCIANGGSGVANLFRFAPLMEKGYFQKNPQMCYVFSIGSPSPHVFSAACVENFVITDHVEIVLKGHK